MKQSSSTAAEVDDGGVILADGRLILPVQLLPGDDANAEHQGSHQHTHPQPQLQDGPAQLGGVILGLLGFPDSGAGGPDGPLGDGDHRIGLYRLFHHHRYQTAVHTQSTLRTM